MYWAIPLTAAAVITAIYYAYRKGHYDGSTEALTKVNALLKQKVERSEGRVTK